MARRNEAASGPNDNGKAPRSVIESQLAEWHRQLAKSAGLISGALARRSVSPMMLNAVLAELRPVLRDMERSELLLQVRDQIDNENKNYKSTQAKGMRERVRSTRK